MIYAGKSRLEKQTIMVNKNKLLGAPDMQIADLNC